MKRMFINYDLSKKFEVVENKEENVIERTTMSGKEIMRRLRRGKW